MSRIPDQIAGRESRGSKSNKFAAAAVRFSPEHSRSWTLTLAVMLLAAAGAQGQAGLAMGITSDDTGSGIIPTATTLGTSTANSGSSQTLLEATVQNANGSLTPAPTGTVTFFNGTVVIGSEPLGENDVATLPLNLPAGSYTITAYYSGDLQHGTSTSPAVTVAFSDSGFNLNVNPATVTVAAAQNATVAVTLSSFGGFADTIGLGCASLPVGVSCHFSSSSAKVAANENPPQSVQLTIDTNYLMIGGSTAKNSHSARSSADLAGLFLPFSLFFGSLLRRFRRRYATVLNTALVLLLCCAALQVTGCCNINSAGAAPGNYVIQVTGAGAGSNIIQSQNVTLTITQ